MKVAQLVGVWVVALALAVVAAVMVWTTWGPESDEEVTDAEAVWCTNNLARVMLAADALGIPIPDEARSTVGDALGTSQTPSDETLTVDFLHSAADGLAFPWLSAPQVWTIEVDGLQQPVALSLARMAGQLQGDLGTWRDSVLGEDAAWPEVWSTPPFDRLCQAAFEGR